MQCPAALFDTGERPVRLRNAKTGGEERVGPEARSRHPKIRRAESKLLAALSRLDGLAEDVLGPELERIRNLAQSLESLRARLRHIRRLQTMRAELRDDLRTALSKIDEITTQISLLRFADHPEREVSDLIEDIAATVDGVSEGVLDAPAEVGAQHGSAVS